MKFFLALLMLLPVSGFSKEGGNGGDVIVCRDANAQIKSIELLDYYEARVMRKFKVMEYPGLTDEEFITAIAEKINSLEDLERPFDTNEALELMNAVRHFIKTGQSKSKGILFTNEVLADIPDSEELFIPRGCYVEQIAIWQYPSFPEDPRFILQADLLKSLSERDLRGVVLHEMIYKTIYNRIRGDFLKDSFSPRYLHEKLMSRELKEFTFSDYFQFLRGLHHRQMSKVAYVKKGKFYLDIRMNYSWPQDDGRIEIMILGTDVKIVLNRDGNIDLKLTKKFGSITVKAHNTWGRDNSGTLFVTHAEVPFSKDNNWRIGIGFGENLMRVNLNPNGSWGPFKNWGFTFQGPSSGEKYFTITAAPGPMEQTFTKKFYLDFNENFDVVIKEIESTL